MCSVGVGVPRDGRRVNGGKYVEKCEVSKEVGTNKRRGCWLPVLLELRVDRCWIV